MRDTGSRLRALLLLSFVFMLPACGGRGGSGTIPPDRMQTPNSISPASVKVAPMVLTPIQPSSVMASRHPRSDIQALGWTQLPGGGIFAAASPDGSLWVLSSIGSGPDRAIWHYANGTWANIPGAAMRMWVAPDTTLWVINSAGGIYAWNGTAWSTIAGGASDITVGSDGSVYVISSQGGGQFGRGIWRYSGGSWTQLPGAAVRIAASWDPGTYPGPYSPIDPGGFYVINAQSIVYYYSPTTGFNIVTFGVAQLAPTKTGGLFQLALPNPDGSYGIFYTNLSDPHPSTRGATQQPGAATSISTDGTSVYATGAAGGIYKAAIVASTTGNAPSVGYLAPTGTGSYAGVLTGFTAGATVVGISTNEIAGGPSSTVGQGHVAYSLGTIALGTSRRPNNVPIPAGRHGYLHRPMENPAAVAELIATLKANTSASPGGLSTRRPRSLPTAIGSHASFWVTVSDIGTSSGHDIQVPATLQTASAGGYVWVDDTLSTLSQATFAKIAADLDNASASDTAHFGQIGFTASAPGYATNASFPVCDPTGSPVPGSSAPAFVLPPDAKVHALLLNQGSLGSGVGGYFTSANYLSQAVLNCLINTNGYTASTVPHSNEAPTFYVGYNATLPPTYITDQDLVRGTAHELQHLINFVHHSILNNDNGEDRWINEGMSMLAQDLALNRKYGIAHDVDDAMYWAQQYLSAPQNYSLTAFTGMDPSASSWQFNCGGCYGSEYLFQRYLYDRFGGDAYLARMLGASSSYANLQQATGVDPQQLISDFAIALAASGSGQTTDPRFGFSSLNLRAPYADQFGNTRTLGSPATAGSLPSSAAPYYGSFVYYSTPASGNGQTLSGRDLGGGFGLQIGVVKK